MELRRLARREGFQDAAERVLAQTSLLDVDRHVLDRASRLDPLEVRSLDAIHLDAAVALAARGEIAAIMTYDRQLQKGCVLHGLAVDAPVGN